MAFPSISRIRGSDTLVNLCPKSVAMRAAFPEVQAASSGMSPAEIGTAIHERVPFFEAIGVEAMAHPAHAADLVRFPDWVPETISKCVAIYQMLADRFPGYRVLTEQFLAMGHQIGLDPEAWAGTADRVLISPDGGHVVVIDLKTGRIHVPADTVQGLNYSVGALDLAPGAKVFTVVIVQPRDAQCAVKVHDWSREAVDAYIAEMAILVPQALSPSAPTTPGLHCRRCGALAHCGPGTDWSLAQLAPLAAVGWSPENLTDPQLSALINVLPQLEALATAARAIAAERLAAGRDIPGYVLGRRSAHRRWRDAEHIQETFAELALDLDIFAPRKPISPVQALKLAPPEIQEALASAVTRPEGVKACVPARENASHRISLADLPRAFPALFPSSDLQP